MAVEVVVNDDQRPPRSGSARCQHAEKGARCGLDLAANALLRGLLVQVDVKHLNAEQIGATHRCGSDRSQLVSSPYSSSPRASRRLCESLAPITRAPASRSSLNGIVAGR